MTVDRFEHDLRRALARHAGDVPQEVVDRLTRRQYAPARRHRRVAAGLAAMAVAVAAGTMGFLIGTRAPAATGAPSGAVDEQAIRLADATISLPAGFSRTDTACVPIPAGLRLVGGSFAAAVSDSGGCITMFLAASTSVPSRGQSVVISGHPGSVVTDSSTGVSTAYITIPADLYIDGSRESVIENGSALLDLVIASRGLSPVQVAAVVAAGVPDHPVSPG